jgi:PIN domain nuclease of toxin-antitoxin system
MGAKARRLLEQALRENDVAVSAISFWEVGMQLQKGRLDLRMDLGVWRRDLLSSGLIEIPVDGAVGARAALLPGLHGDPADRIIVATALQGHRLMTADRLILNWAGSVYRLDATT